jgi:hypothetical protein
VNRPTGITALSFFFGLGSIISLTAAASLHFAGGPLDLIWTVNRTARRELVELDAWGVLLLVAVSVVCAASAIGLWTARRWGRHVAMGTLVANLIGDLANALLRHDPRTLVGVPIVLLLILYLRGPSVRRFTAA